LECDPTRPRYIHCEGLQKLLALPCVSMRHHQAYPEDPAVCIQWRKAHKMTRDLVWKIVWQPVMGPFQNYHAYTYAQFNWKTRTQYHFAKFIWWEGPEQIRMERCVYLFKWPFIWGPYSAFYPDPINVYTKFRGIPLLPDGTPDVPFSHNEWGWKFPPNPQLYTWQEWQIITDWEKQVFYYNHAHKSCVARYEWGGDFVTETTTGRTGFVLDILMPRRDTEWWDPELKFTKMTVRKDQWMKYRPLIFRVEAVFPPGWTPGDPLPPGITLDPKFGDQTYFDTARRKLSRF